MHGGRRWHPWRALRGRPDVTVVFDDLGPDTLGLVDYAQRRITLDRSLLQVERRCTLTHELIHLERGPASSCDVVDAEEFEVARLAAERLITTPDLIRAVQWSDHPDELACELWVDRDTVDVRLRHLTPRERDQLAAVRASRDGHHDHGDDEGAA